MMNVAAVADEGEIVCSFIFKNAWAMENLDKICGQHSLPVTRTEFDLWKGWRPKTNLDRGESQVTQQGSESLRRPVSPF